MYRLAALPLLFLPLFASANCTDQLQTWAKTLRPDLKPDSARAVCKINPANANQILAALPFEENVDEDGQGDFGLAVIVVDAATGKIVAQHYQAAAISSDAVRFESLALDTARYQLAPKLRAFGVRVSYEGSSRPNPFGSTALTLYTLNGKQFRPVLSQLEVSKSVGEWDMQCAGDFIRTQRTISIANQNRNGLANLRVDQKVTHTENRPKGEDCEYIDGPTESSSVTLEFDGDRYPVPKGLSTL